MAKGVKATKDGEVVKVQYQGATIAARDSTVETAEKIAYYVPALVALAVAVGVGRPLYFDVRAGTFELATMTVTKVAIFLVAFVFGSKRLVGKPPPSKVLQKSSTKGRSKGSKRAAKDE